MKQNHHFFSYDYYQENQSTTSVCSNDNNFIENGGFIHSIHNFTNLVSLKLNNTLLERLDNIASLQITFLDVSGNRITSLEPLIYLTSLQLLNASSNPISFIPPLPELKLLNLADCPIEDNKQTVRALYRMTSLTCLHLPRSTRIKELDPVQAFQFVRLERRQTKLIKAQKEYYTKINNYPAPLLFDSDVYIRTLVLFLPLLVVFNKERIDITVRRLLAQSVNEEISIPTNTSSVLDCFQKRPIGKMQRNYSSFVSALYGFNSTPFDSLMPLNNGPRQIEYNRCIPGRILVGSLNGNLHILDIPSNTITQVDSPFTSSPYGICWCSHQSKSNQCIVGNDTGTLCYFDFSRQLTPLIQINGLERITSTHINCSCNKFITSGFETNVNLFDYQTHQLERVFGSFHQGSVNVAKFANTNPYLITTCSFDCNAGIWDLRTDCLTPVMKYNGETLLVTTVFSEDDSNILIAGSDNYVESIDIRTKKGIKMQLERVWKNDSYCRAYYCNGGESVVVSNSNEPTLHIARTFDGKRIIDCHYDRTTNQRPFDGIITVRCDPFNDFDFSLIMNDDELDSLGLFHCHLI